MIEAAEKMAALRRFTNHVVPGRWEEVRPPTERELKATTVLALAIEEASAKVRTGPPIDDEEDYEWPVWAGVVPLRMSVGEPVADGRVLAEVPSFDITIGDSNVSTVSSSGRHRRLGRAGDGLKTSPANRMSAGGTPLRACRKPRGRWVATRRGPRNADEAPANPP